MYILPVSEMYLWQGRIGKILEVTTSGSGCRDFFYYFSAMLRDGSFSTIWSDSYVHKVIRLMHIWTRKSPLNCVSHP